MEADKPLAFGRCGRSRLPGQVQRPGDPLKHLGPTVDIPAWSPLFQTRCGLDRSSGDWTFCHDGDDIWCIGCLQQGGVPYVQEMM